MFQSKVLTKLRAGKPALCTNASAGPSPMVCGLAAKIGFDAVWIDAEHRGFSEDQIAAMILAVRLAGADPLVRVRKESPASYFRPLEMGAAGVMVPHIKSPEDAEVAVRNFRFAPQGLRGIDGVGVDADYGLAAVDEHLSAVNEQSWLLLQIEDREAIDCIDQIAAVKGFDILLVGSGDMAQSLGVPGQFSHAKLIDAIALVKQAAVQHDKTFGQIVTLEAAKDALQSGARFICIGADLPLLTAGWRHIHDDFHTVTSEMGF